MRAFTAVGGRIVVTDTASKAEESQGEQEAAERHADRRDERVGVRTVRQYRYALSL